MSDIQNKIVNALVAAQKAPTGKVSLHATGRSADGFRNEMLFFIKPELTRTYPGRQTDYAGIVALALAQLERFGMTVLSIDLLGAQYLKESRAVAGHYGVINRLSNEAQGALSETARTTFAEKFGLSVEAAKPLGAFEFMKQNPALNADALDLLWQNVTNTKLAGGTYCAHVKYDGRMTYLINGFHPRQLEHFVQDGRSIVTFHVATNTDWATARNDFVGVTNPAKANPGSLRRILLEKREALGLEEISQGINGVHLSAGPVEGLVELCRFSGLNPEQDLNTIGSFALGQALLRAASPATVRDILRDTKISVGGKPVSVFEATEEKNADDALAILKSAGMDLAAA